MEIILSKATSECAEKFFLFSQTFGGVEHIESLLEYVNTRGSTGNVAVMQHLMRVLASLTYGNEERMAPLIRNFTPVLDFNAFDFEHTPEDEQRLELFCILTSGIDRNAIGNTLKDYIISLGIVKQALEYVTVSFICVIHNHFRSTSECFIQCAIFFSVLRSTCKSDLVQN